MVFQGLRQRNEWKFFGVLPKADYGLAVAWWVALILRGVLPAVFAIAMGSLVGAVQRRGSLAGPLTLVGSVFILLQVLTPIHQAISSNLGDPTAAWLYDRLTEACVRPPGMGHLEDTKLTTTSPSRANVVSGITRRPNQRLKQGVEWILLVYA
jgi:hypothetical protein